MTMRIAQLCCDRGIAPGSTKGAAQHLRGIAGGFVAEGHPVTTFAAREAEGPYPVPVQPTEAFDEWSTGPNATRFDLVYERYSLGSTDGLEAARRMGALHVLEVNAPLVAEARAHRPGSVAADDERVERRLLHESDLVVTVSSPLTRWVQRYRSGPTVTVRNGFEPAWFADPARPVPVASDRPVLAFIGHPKPWHGADRLVPLLGELHASGQTADLLVIGGGPGVLEIERQAERMGLADHVAVTGALPPHEAAAKLLTASVGVAPYPEQSDFYFCPLKIIDYLAAGLPIVSTRQGDIAALVGGAGIVVEPADDHALAGAIAELLVDPARAAHRGRTGRLRAHATMTWHHVAERTLGAIHAVASQAA